jgi:hypothetical protein
MSFDVPPTLYNALDTKRTCLNEPVRANDINDPVALPDIGSWWDNHLIHGHDSVFC